MRVTSDRAQSEPASNHKISSRAFSVDLVLYLSVTFLIREVYFQSLGFMVNGLFWSFSALVVAAWRMKARGVSWTELGLCKPAHFRRTVAATVFILGMAIGSIIIFEILKDQLGWDLSPDTSTKSAVSKFGDLENNWVLFFSIIPVIWLESFLEEVLDRGFLMNWIERMFSSTQTTFQNGQLLSALSALPWGWGMWSSVGICGHSFLPTVYSIRCQCLTEWDERLHCQSPTQPLQADRATRGF
jgi:hypothetical protein